MSSTFGQTALNLASKNGRSAASYRAVCFSGSRSATLPEALDVAPPLHAASKTARAATATMTRLGPVCVDARWTETMWLSFSPVAEAPLDLADAASRLSWAGQQTNAARQ